MPRPLRYFGQALVYGLIAVLLGFFADSPVYERFPEDQGQLTLNIAHSGERLGDCRRLTAEEIAALPPRERKPMICEDRGRQAVVIEVELDGELLVGEAVPPSGLFGDGPSQLYANFVVPSGRHNLVARLRDSDRTEGFDYTREESVEIEPRQRLVIEFQAEFGGFIFTEAVLPEGFRTLAGAGVQAVGGRP